MPGVCLFVCLLAASQLKLLKLYSIVKCQGADLMRTELGRSLDRTT